MNKNRWIDSWNKDIYNFWNSNASIIGLWAYKNWDLKGKSKKREMSKLLSNIEL
jgi:hypothetical protein